MASMVTSTVTMVVLLELLLRQGLHQQLEERVQPPADQPHGDTDGRERRAPEPSKRRQDDDHEAADRDPQRQVDEASRCGSREEARRKHGDPHRLHEEEERFGHKGRAVG